MPTVLTVLPMLTLTLASWRHYLRRSLATVLAVFLGVGFCAVTLTLTAAAKQGVGDAVAVQYSAADAVAIVPAAAASALTQQVRTVPAVATAESIATGSADFGVGGSAGLGYQAVTEVPTQASLRWETLSSGAWPTGAGQVGLDASTANSAGLHVGSTIVVRSISSAGTALPPRALRVVAIITHHKGADGAATVFAAPGALSAWRVGGAQTEIDLLAAPGVSSTQLVAQLSALATAGHASGLEPGQLATTDALREQAVSGLTDDVDVLGLFLEGFAGISLFVAGLVVANTLRIVMVQRAREFALLRCVGAQRGQITSMVLGEAALLAGLGTLGGLVAGIGVAGVLVSVLNATTLPVPFTFTLPSVASLAVPVLGGLLVTMVAASAPALAAARLAPVEALRPAGMEAPVSPRGVGALRLGAGVLVGVFGTMLLGLATRTGQLPIGLLGGLLSFVGVLAWCPVLVPSTVRLFAVLRRLLPRRLRGGVPASFASLNTVRHPRRTAAAAGALLVGVTLISMLSVGAASVSATESQALNRVTPVDLTISGTHLPATLARQVRAVDGVDSVVEARGGLVSIGGRDVRVAALTSAQATLVVRDPGLRTELHARGTLVVPAGLGQTLPGGGAGDVTLTGPETGPVRLTPVLSSISGGPLLVAPSTLARLGGAQQPIALYIRAAASADPSALTAALQQVIHHAGAGHEVGVSGGFVKRSTYDDAVTVMLLVATAMLAVAVLIALVGVGNTLGLSVLERTREHGVLRALGLTRNQLRLMLAHEGLLMAGAAALLGVALGIGYGWAGTLTLLHGTVSTGPSLEIPWLRLLAVVAVALVAGVLAAMLPARRAVAVAPTEALAEG